jgi:hypothetical protein
VSTLAVAMRDSHGEFAKKAQANTAELLDNYSTTHERD